MIYPRYGSNSDGSHNIVLTNSNIALPVDVQANLTETLLEVTADNTNISSTTTHLVYYGKTGFIEKFSTNVNRENAIDCSNHIEKVIVIKNDYDVEIKLDVFYIDYWGNMHYAITATSITLATETKKLITSVDYPILGKPIPYMFLRVGVTAGDPTTGTVSLTVEGQ